MEKNSILEIQGKIKQLEQETTSYLNEIKKLISNTPQKSNLKLMSYFTYTISISHEKESESIIIGTYHIHNIGNNPLNNPYICVNHSPNSPFLFSGKYVTKKTNLSMKTTDTWERLLNEQTNKEEYWLKPIGTEVIAPNQILSFSNFQAKWISNGSYAGSIMGFTYCDEFKEGIPAINQINVSGN